MLRWMIRGLLVLALVWSGYWVAGSYALEKATRDWFVQTPAATNDGIAVAGYPNRFDLTVTAPRLAAAPGGVGWRAPFLQVLTLSYTPWHIIAALPPEQWFETPQGDLRLASEKLQASVVFVPSPDLALDRATLVGSGLMLEAGGQAIAQAASLRLASRQAAVGTNAHEFALEAEDLVPLWGLADIPAMQRVHLEGMTQFSAPLDRFAAQTQPQISALRIDVGRVEWGTVGLTVTGALAPDAQGFAAGDLMVAVENWQAALDQFGAMGLMDPASLPGLTSAGQFLALQSGDAAKIEITVNFADGFMRVNGLPLGPAPRFR